MKDYNYYIPGYTGFCPDLKDHFGQTYGRATRQILREEVIPCRHLKERLAPVFYKEKKWGKNLKRFGHLKQCERDAEDCCCHREDRGDDAQKRSSKACQHGHQGRHEQGTQTGETARTRPILKRHEKCFPDYFAKGKDKAKVRIQEVKRDRRESGDAGPKQDPDHLCCCPGYVYVQSIAEYYPMRWDPTEGADFYHVHYPPEAVHAHASANGHPHKDPSCIRGDDHCHNTPQVVHACRAASNPPHQAPSCAGTDSYCPKNLRRVPRIKPHREGGVIPKYTGHIPGLVFSFGESYGPASDRLLRRHHDNMKQLFRK